jgi:hypothetical protein
MSYPMWNAKTGGSPGEEGPPTTTEVLSVMGLEGNDRPGWDARQTAPMATNGKGH